MDIDETLCQVSDIDRLKADLEFVQMLSNTQYLLHLAQHKYFEDDKFLNYLKYLQYWKNPQYAKYILFPVSLDILDAINNSAVFRQALENDKFCSDLYIQLGGLWVAGPQYK